MKKVLIVCLFAAAFVLLMILPGVFVVAVCSIANSVIPDKYLPNHKTKEQS